MERELSVLRTYFDGLITYGLELGLDRIPDIAHRLKYRGIILGVWNPKSQHEVETAIRLALTFREVLAICVGNEGLSVHHTYSLDDVSSAIGRIHEQAPGVLCTTSEPILPLYMTSEKLRATGDFLAPNVHAFWALPEKASMEAAVNWTLEQVHKLAGQVSNRLVLVKESGWPSGGRADCTPERQKEFWQRLMERRHEWPPNVTFVVFEGADLPAKGASGRPTEGYWGVFEVGMSRPKPAMTVFPPLPDMPIAQPAEQSQAPSAPPEELALDAPPLYSRDVVLIPLRQVAQALGVTLDAKEKTITLGYKGARGVLTVGARKARVNDKTIELPVAPEHVGDVLYAPVRVLQLLLGADITPPEGTRPVIITVGAKRWAIPFGSSEQYTVKAWNALDARRYDDALLHAQTCIKLYMDAARQQEKEKKAAGGIIPWRRGGPEEVKQRIFSYWALNDCAACLFIIGEINYNRGNRAAAQTAFQTIKRELSTAQIWDPQGWFWSPVESIGIEYPDIDP
jgi:exo-beta-1,3-glucanase (GH17 family)